MARNRNLGMMLERMIEQSNRAYLERGLALVQKIPTPTSINKGKGTAYYKEKSTVDFIGVYGNGKHVAFDAKETKVNNFAFSRVQEHQVKYLTNTLRFGGEAFLIILFTSVNECYRLDINEYHELRHMFKEQKRKSIPLVWFRENKEQVTSKYGIYYDYLGIAGKTKGGGY